MVSAPLRIQATQTQQSLPRRRRRRPPAAPRSCTSATAPRTRAAAPWRSMCKRWWWSGTAAPASCSRLQTASSTSLTSTRSSRCAAQRGAPARVAYCLQLVGCLPRSNLHTPAIATVRACGGAARPALRSWNVLLKAQHWGSKPKALIRLEGASANWAHAPASPAQPPQARAGVHALLGVHDRGVPASYRAEQRAAVSGTQGRRGDSAEPPHALRVPRGRGAGAAAARAADHALGAAQSVRQQVARAPMRLGAWQR